MNTLPLSYFFTEDFVRIYHWMEGSERHSKTLCSKLCQHIQLRIVNGISAILVSDGNLHFVDCEMCDKYGISVADQREAQRLGEEWGKQLTQNEIHLNSTVIPQVSAYMAGLIL